MGKLLKKIVRAIKIWDVKYSLRDLEYQMMLFEIPFWYYEHEKARLIKILNQLKAA